MAVAVAASSSSAKVQAIACNPLNSLDQCLRGPQDAAEWDNDDGD